MPIFRQRKARPNAPFQAYENNAVDLALPKSRERRYQVYHMNRRWCTPTLDSRATTASTTDAVASSKKKRSQTESHAGMTHDYFWCRKNANDVFVCFVFFSCLGIPTGDLVLLSLRAIGGKKKQTKKLQFQHLVQLVRLFCNTGMVCCMSRASRFSGRDGHVLGNIPGTSYAATP